MGEEQEMARPTTKKELLDQATMQFEKLQALIASMSEAQQDRDFCFQLTDKDKETHWKRDKNLRDVLIHLYEWHQLLLTFVTNNRGRTKVIPFLPAPYNWRNYGELNRDFWEKHQLTGLVEAKRLLQKSHTEALSLIESFSDEELFTKAYFPWSGTTSVGAYCVSATSSHYNWAIKKLKRQIKALG